MTALTVLSYARGIISHIPLMHWAVIGGVSLALTAILLIRKKCSVYCAIALGMTVFMGLFLLDTAVGIRYFGFLGHAAGHNLTLDFSRILQKNGLGSADIISNIAVFVPFGFFLEEWLASLNRTSPWRRVGLVIMAAFGLSLCIECLQLFLYVGFFEVTDLVMNTVGGFIGALISVGLRKVVGKRSH